MSQIIKVHKSRKAEIVGVRGQTIKGLQEEFNVKISFTNTIEEVCYKSEFCNNNFLK